MKPGEGLAAGRRDGGEIGGCRLLPSASTLGVSAGEPDLIRCSGLWSAGSHTGPIKQDSSCQSESQTYQLPHHQDCLEYLRQLCPRNEGQKRTFAPGFASTGC